MHFLGSAVLRAIFKDPGVYQLFISQPHCIGLPVRQGPALEELDLASYLLYPESSQSTAGGEEGVLEKHQSKSTPVESPGICILPSLSFGNHFFLSSFLT